MRIGHFMRGMFDPGGIAAYIRQLSGEQAARGHEIAFYDVAARGSGSIGTQKAVDSSLPCLRYVPDSRDLFDAAKRDGMDILHLHCEVECDAKPPLPVLRTIHNHHPYCSSGARFLARSKQVCDCRPSLIPCLRGRFLEHCGSVRPANIRQDLRRTRQEQQMLRYVPAICISEYMKQEMVQAGYSAERLHVVYHAAPAPETEKLTLPPQEEAPHFVFMGRLTTLKGADTLLQAMARMAAVRSYLDIAGTGPLEAGLRRQAQELGLSQRVRFHGWLEPAQTRNLLRQARALVFPSVWPEPAGLVTLEAAAMGRAVIGTRVGGLPEYALHEQSALLVAPGNADEMAGAMDRLATDWALAARLGEQGWRLARERFTPARHCAQVHELYAQYAADFPDARELT